MKKAEGLHREHVEVGAAVMRVLVTAMLQMVGVQTIGSIPEPVVVTGWSSESKVRSASGAAQPGGAPERLEAAPIWRRNGLMWRSEGGA